MKTTLKNLAAYLGNASCELNSLGFTEKDYDKEVFTSFTPYDEQTPIINFYFIDEPESQNNWFSIIDWDSEDYLHDNDNLISTEEERAALENDFYELFEEKL